MKRNLLFLTAFFAALCLNLNAQTHLKNDPKNIVWVTFDKYDTKGQPINECKSGPQTSIVDSTLESNEVKADYTQNGKFGKCVTLTTKNQPWEGDALFIPYDASWKPIDNTVTLAAWVNPVAVYDWADVVAWGTDAGGHDQNIAYALGYNASGAITFTINWGSGGGGGPVMNGATAGSVVAGQWQHIAVVWDGITATFYLDGAEVGAESPTAPQVLQADYIDYMIIGVGYGGGNEGINGKVDEVRIINRNLSAGEIDTLAFEKERVTTGINDLASNKSYSVRYSDASKLLTVNAINGVKNVIVYDVTGKAILKETANQKSKNISTSGLKPGVYIVKINGAYSSKFVVR